MFDYIKARLNNSNDKVFYRKYPESIPIATIPDEKNNDLVGINEKELEKLERLETYVRDENLRVYKKSQLDYLRLRFIFIIMPLILLGGVFFSFFAMPSRIKERKNAKKYSVEQIYIDTNRGVKKDISEIYSIESSFSDLYMDKVDVNFTVDHKNVINFKITDSTNYIESKLHFEDNNKLEFDNIESESGKFLDLKEYDNTDFESINPKYENLINEIIEVIDNANYVSKKQKEELKNLAESEKKQIIVELKNYIENGEEEIDINWPSWPLKAGLVLLCLVYYKKLRKMMGSKGLNRGTNFTVDKGKLLETNSSGNILTGPEKNREQFIWAEKSRIIEVYKIAQKNLYEPEKILTHYEKKLVLDNDYKKVLKRDKVK